MCASYVIPFYDVPKWGCFYCEVIWIWRNSLLSACLSLAQEEGEEDVPYP